MHDKRLERPDLGGGECEEVVPTWLRVTTRGVNVAQAVEWGAVVVLL